MSTAQRASVNRQIANEGIPLELICVEGDHPHFVHASGARRRASVPYINSITCAQWLREARAAWRDMQEELVQ